MTVSEPVTKLQKEIAEFHEQRRQDKILLGGSSTSESIEMNLNVDMIVGPLWVGTPLYPTELDP